MPARRLIIDGYSLLHRHPQLSELLSSNLMLARQRLIRDLEEMTGHVASQVTIVFDGTSTGGRDEEFGSDVVDVVFSPANMTADSVIERLVMDAPIPEEITVVTSDRDERITVSAAGAHTMSCTDFLEDLATKRRSATGRAIRRKPPKGPKLGDFFPDG